MTGTIAAAAGPAGTQFTRMGIDTNADGLANNLFPDSNTSGFLDVGDVLSQIILAATDRLALVTRTVSRSLYLTSRMDFDVYGSGAKFTSTGTFGPAVTLASVGLAVSFTDNGIEAVAAFAEEVNRRTENIGARRLGTLLERVLEEVSFEADALSGTRVVVDRANVESRVRDLAADADLSRFIL